MTLFQQFKHNRDTRADEAAFLIAAGDRSVPILWRQFADDIEAIAWIIQKYVPGATIALLGANSYEWMTVHAACVFSGAVALPLEVNLSAEDIAERLSFTGARVLMHSALLADRAREVKKMLPKLIIGGFGTRVTDRVLSAAHKALNAGDTRLFDLPERNEDETAMLVFTSGTTSKPRGAELTAHGLRAFSDFWSAMLHFESGQRTLMLLPLHHIFGISVTYMMLAHGVALGVCPDFRRIYEAVERFDANFLFLVPALAEMLADKISRKAQTAEAAGLSLRWLLAGGAPLPNRTFLKLQDLGIRPIVGYGLTETTALYSCAELDDPHPGSAGKCCQGYGGMEARVSPEGILQLRGPSVMKGYYKEPARTAAVLDAEGWFSTGDYGRIDEDGYVWITGRASRTIILSSGKKVAPEELEEKLLSVPGFLEVVVSGDSETREVQAEVYASVSEQTVHEQIAIVNQKLPLHKRVRRIVVRTEPFPRTASGKICVAAKPKPQAPSRNVAPPAAAPELPQAEASKTFVQTALVKNAAITVSRQVGRLLENRWTGRVLLVATIAAIGVISLNFLQMAIVRLGIELPTWASRLLALLEESGEFLLALVVLPMLLLVYYLMRQIKDRGAAGN
ncbi:MAG: AMP-binding protein [Kiritimatiellae bacterium]|nr:AMP-binding protein [Kiritimatiellia bacterium]